MNIFFPTDLVEVMFSTQNPNSAEPSKRMPKQNIIQLGQIEISLKKLKYLKV